MAEETKNVDTATEIAENVEVKVGDTVPDEEPKPDIPEELAGLPEKIAREAMEEAAKATPEDTEEEQDEPSEVPVEESSPAEKKQDDVLPNQSIPYVRFKQQLDENHKLKEQLKQLQQQQNNNQASMQQPVMAPGNQPLQQEPSVTQPVPQQAQNNQMQPQQVSQPQTPVINAEVTAQIEQAIRQEAMRMSGLDEETINSMEYMDDNDNRRQIWNTAQAMARSEIFRRIEAERQRQLDESRRIIAVHNKNVLAYNQFAREQMSDPDFENIKNYATNEFFNKFKDDSLYQEAVAGAYARIERNMGSAQDIAVIRRFFTDAKNEYKKTRGTGGKTSNIEKKVRQGQAFPRSGDISGAGNDGGNVTVETLSRMLETTPFEQIPEEYQRKLLGYE